MKRLIGFLVIIGFACGGYAQDTTQHDYLHIAWPAPYTNGTAYSTGSNTNAYDLTAYNGKAKLIITVSADEGTAAATSGVVFVQQADAKTGTWSTVTALSAYMPTLNATAKVATINVDLETLKNWVRIGVTQSSLAETNCQHTVGAMLVAPHKDD